MIISLVFLIILPGVSFAASFWSYTNVTDIVDTDEAMFGSSVRNTVVNITWPNLLDQIETDGGFFNTGNDGVGSLLDADFLDGLTSSQFLQYGSLLQTEASDSPTALSVNGQFNVDNDDDQWRMRIGGSNYIFDFTGDSSGYVLKSNGSGLFTLQAENTIATSGDSATSFFSSGTIEHERGGLQADVSAYSGLTGINGGVTVEVDTEAELYTMIADVTQFYEPGDLLRTEASNSPTALDTNGQFNIDNDDELLTVRIGGSNRILDFSGDASGYVFKSNGSGTFTLQAENTVATSGDSATSFFSSGTIEHERGGLEADVSAYAGLVAISGGSTSQINDESGLYSMLSDVTQFYEPGDLIQTEAGNTPTALDTDGQINVDTDDEQLLMRVGGATKTFDFSSDGSGYVLKSDGSGSFSLAAESGGSSIIYDLADDGSNESTALGEIAVTGDTNSIFTEPSADKMLIAVGNNWPTCDIAVGVEAGNTPTTPSSDGEMVVDTDDEQFIVRVNGGNKTFDFSGDSSGYVLKSNGSGVFSLAADASGGGGTPNILDLDDDSSNESSDLVEIATTGDTNSIFTEPSADKLLIDLGQNWPTADVAEAIPAGNTPTTPSADGELVVDTDDEQFIIRVNGVNQTFDFSGDTSDYVLKSNGSGVFTLQEDEVGDVEISGTITDDDIAYWVDETHIAGYSDAEFKAAYNLEIGTDVQAYDADLTTYAGITPLADTQSLLASSNFGSMRALLDLEVGTDVQAYDADLTTYAGITPSSDVQTMLGSANNAAIISNIGAESATSNDIDPDRLAGDTTDDNQIDQEILETPFIQSRTISDPTTDDDYYWFKANAALTVTGVDCIAQGTSPSITVDVQECDSSGASCSSILSSAITCNGGNDAGSLSDSSVASGAWVYVALGTPSGTVDGITFTLRGTQ